MALLMELLSGPPILISLVPDVVIAHGLAIWYPAFPTVKGPQWPQSAGPRVTTF